MIIVYFNVQGVVDPRDGHCLIPIYVSLCEVEGDLWEQKKKNLFAKEKNLFIYFFILLSFN